VTVFRNEINNEQSKEREKKKEKKEKRKKKEKEKKERKRERRKEKRKKLKHKREIHSVLDHGVIFKPQEFREIEYSQKNRKTRRRRSKT
jgi:hypothetical protein